jgi:hypothetical protein
MLLISFIFKQVSSGLFFLFSLFSSVNFLFLTLFQLLAFSSLLVHIIDSR